MPARPLRTRLIPRDDESDFQLEKAANDLLTRRILGACSLMSEK
jgi:hypothetical protein